MPRRRTYGITTAAMRTRRSSRYPRRTATVWLITVLMAAQDPDAHKNFDALYRFYKAHPSVNNRDLMAWQQGDDGKAITDTNGADSATDGDMDIALRAAAG